MDILVETDSEDELLEEFGLRRRNAKIVRPRPNYFEELIDSDFAARFRLGKQTVLRLLHLINDDLETPTNRNSSVSPMCQLLLTLRFYATGSFLIVVGDFTGVHKSTASAIVLKVTRAIAKLRPQFIKFPQTPAEISEVHYSFFQKAAFPRVLGAIDCTHIKILSPGGNNAEEYRNRKGYFSYNVQTISDHNLRILDIVARWPGAVHDSTIFHNSVICAKFEAGNYGRSVLMCDSGYACCQFMIPPLRNPVLPEEHVFNESQIRTRNPVERQYGVWKRRFPVLAMGIRLKTSSVQAIIVACAVLHNIAIEANENLPPVDPELHDDVERSIVNGQVQQEPTQGGHEGACKTFISYFQSLLE